MKASRCRLRQVDFHISRTTMSTLMKPGAKCSAAAAEFSYVGLASVDMVGPLILPTRSRSTLVGLVGRPRRRLGSQSHTKATHSRAAAAAAASAAAATPACPSARPPYALHHPHPYPHLHTVSRWCSHVLDAAFTCASLAVVRSEKVCSPSCFILTELRLRVAGTPFRSSSSKICGRCAR